MTRYLESDRVKVSPQRENHNRKRKAARSKRSRSHSKARKNPQGSVPAGARARTRRKKIGALFEALVALQARLRAPNGCPWDREQTHESLRTFLIEETYEVLEAIDSGNDAALAGELGDLLLQIVFHAQLAREAGRFDIGNVIERIRTKMVRRHPHVFGRVKARTSAQVLKNWERLKAEERRMGGEEAAGELGEGARANGASILDGVPHTLPALLEAYQLTRRASRIGFDWDHIEGLFQKLEEESRELREVLGHRDKARLEDEVGDLLFVAVNVARFLDLDPEIALKKANRKFAARFREMEEAAAKTGRRLAETSKEELEVLWEASKEKPLKTSGPREPR